MCRCGARLRKESGRLKPGLNHRFAFDPTYGYELSSLLSVEPPAAPVDFATFWREAYRVAVGLELGCVIDAPTVHGGVAVSRLAFTSWDGDVIEGWLTLPHGRPATHGLVVGHGYGGREAPELDLSEAGAAAIFPCVRGLGLSRRPAAFASSSVEHVLCGIASRETYIHLGCVADHWCAATALLGAVPGVAGRLGFLGSSFSGGLGAIAVAFDPRFGRAALNVPSYGHHPLRLTLPCVGSGESVRTYAQRHPAVAEVLRYFDAAVASGFVEVPTLVGVARFDPSVPPPGQAAVFNALGGSRALFVRTAGHFAFLGEAQEQRDWRELCRAWFRALALEPA